MPDWLTGLGRIGRLLGAHERNVQQGGAGQEPSLPGGYGYHGFSGPGAAYGPGGITPTRGLFDQGRPADAIWDMPEMRPPGGGDGGPAPRRRGGGGGGGNFEFTPYAGLQHRAQFVDWQPIAPGTSSNEPTRFVPGAGSSTPATSVPPAPGGKPGKQPGGRGGRGGAGGGGGTGRGGGRQPGAGGGGGGARQPGAQGGGGDGSIFDSPAPPRGPFVNVGGSARPNIMGGIDTNFLDFRTPGWRRDPTTGIVNTSGMPLPTPPAQGAFESDSAYRERLHDIGFTEDDIMSMTGPGSGWGTGGVVRGEGGYQFANAEQPGYRPDLWFQGDYPGMSRDASDRGAGPSLFAGGGGQTGMTRNQEGSFNDFLTAANGGWMLR